MSSNENQCFGPLTLQQKNVEPKLLNDEPQNTSCVLCEESFLLPQSEKQMLTHLFMEHRLVIADVDQIADIKEYVRYWRFRFKDHDVPYYCSTMLLDSKPDGTKSEKEEYYLLSNVLPEDKELRSNLLQTKLEKVLERHQFEREDSKFVKECLFCRFESNTTRADYLNHLYKKHNFHIAKPENLIFVDELVDMLSKKLENLHCIYCEGVFKDRTILKEHMRKKGHKRINPDKKEYDRFYIVNYLNDKKTKKPKKYKEQSETVNSRDVGDQESNNDSDPDWSDWTEDNGPLITCLLCEHSEMEYENLLDHMERQHCFYFTRLTEGLDFYKKVKIVNYIRRKVYLKQCLSCDTEFKDSKNLEKHFKETDHLKLTKLEWDQPEYYFPTYEDDLFLCFIHDDDESWWSGDEQHQEQQNSTSDSVLRDAALSAISE